MEREFYKDTIRLVYQPPINGEITWEGGVDADGERGNGTTDIFAFDINDLILGGAIGSKINHGGGSKTIVFDGNFGLT